MSERADAGSPTRTGPGVDAAATVAAPMLVPELLVSDLASSLAFWCDCCGFEIAYERVEEGFAYLRRGSAHLMLEQRGAGRNWISGSLK